MKGVFKGLALLLTGFGFGWIAGRRRRVKRVETVLRASESVSEPSYIREQDKPSIDELVSQYKSVEEADTSEKEEPEKDPIDELDDLDWDVPEVEERPERDPFQIGYEDFYDGYEEYDAESLTYFQGDATLLDEGDCIINNPQKILGVYLWNALARYRQDSMFVVNEKDNTKYAITVLHDMSYADEYPDD